MHAQVIYLETVSANKNVFKKVSINNVITEKCDIIQVHVKRGKGWGFESISTDVIGFSQKSQQDFIFDIPSLVKSMCKNCCNDGIKWQSNFRAQRILDSDCTHVPLGLPLSSHRKQHHCRKIQWEHYQLAPLLTISLGNTLNLVFLLDGIAEQNKNRTRCVKIRSSEWSIKSTWPVQRSSHLLDEPLAALMSSSAKHSAIVFTFLKALSRAPVVSR
jgi:hypothetical protein